MSDPTNTQNTDAPTSDDILARMEAQNRAVLEQMNDLRNFVQTTVGQLSVTPQNQPPEDPIPETLTGQEFMENPGKYLNILKNNVIRDLNAQIAPANRAIAETARDRAIANLMTTLEANTAYKHIKNEYVRANFLSSLSGVNEINASIVNLLYHAAVGAAETAGKLNPSSSGGDPTSRLPAHLPPASRGTVNGRPNLPPLSSMEETIRKSRGWSHARAALMFGKISETDYKKLEPEGKTLADLEAASGIGAVGGQS